MGQQARSMAKVFPVIATSTSVLKRMMASSPVYAKRVIKDKMPLFTIPSFLLLLLMLFISMLVAAPLVSAPSSQEVRYWQIAADAPGNSVEVMTVRSVGWRCWREIRAGSSRINEPRCDKALVVVGGEYQFRTRGDNLTEPDQHMVPEGNVHGLVIRVIYKT